MCIECGRPAYAKGACKTHYNKANGYGLKKQIEAPCKRCGVVRHVRNAERAKPLCRDCKTVLPVEMRAAWYDEVAVAA